MPTAAPNGSPLPPPLGRVLMVQGTASDAGKSTLVTALCRVFARAGYRVAPFKAQNMSNNAAVVDGGEIGRAQAVQAMAAGVEATVDMNPVLVKPQADRTAQVVLLGRPLRTEDARDYYARKLELWPAVAGALDRLRAAHDVVLIEGAGSPAEINLAPYDIANMRVARHAGAPVLLVGDIERGGVFAALYGTVALLAPEARRLVRGFVVNRFRGDPSILAPGFAELEARTGIPTLGTLPYLDLARLPAEDGLALDAQGRLAYTPPIADPVLGVAVLEVAVLGLPRIANADELQPLAAEPGVQLRFVRDATALGTPDLVIVPGTKATMVDLAWARERGLVDRVRALRAAGTPVLGICGGYQMLGVRVADPLGVDGAPGAAEGFGLLAVTTTFAADKVTERVRARTAVGTALWAADEDDAATLDAYEIHMGRTEPVGEDDRMAEALGHTRGDTLGALRGDARASAFAAAGAPPFAVTARDGRRATDGAVSDDGLVIGTYLHGLLENAAFRRRLVVALAARKGLAPPPAAPDGDRGVEAAFDALADAVRDHLDLPAIFAMTGLPAPDR